ncbi:MAG: M23 family metallopeptidase [Dehalococcoidia bacterium]|nr:M23 family metallopeptidase [Dehalococcoidia bacterium]
MALASACGGGGDGDAKLVFNSPSHTSVANASPTPTSTPIPPPELILSATTVYQAGAVLVSVVGEVTGGNVQFLGRTFPLAQGSQSLYTFVPVDAEDAPGDHPLRVDFVLSNGSQGHVDETISVISAQWTVDAIDVPESQTGLLDPRVGADELELLNSVYAKVTPQKLWTGPWAVPTAGALTTRFGEQRSYNGSEPSGHHGGTDIGAAEGTPVYATNTGRVVLARELRLRGNMVVVDHGGGLFSGYAHMSAFSVAEGQFVQQGDLIGYVGNTGLSTGAHLHWEMSAGGVLVDGMRFTDGTNGF